MHIVCYPDPVLSRVATPVPEVTTEVRNQVAQMFEIMYEAPGVGLAAPQVGWSVRLFVVNPNASPEEGKELVFINPKILARKGKTVAEEGCLSIPGIMGQVRRARDLHIRATDLDGNQFELEASDLLARIIQHESDHLDGILFTSKVIESEWESVQEQLRMLKERAPTP